MKINIELERELRKHMVENGYDPDDSISADEKPHEFEVYKDEKHLIGKYQAFLYPFGPHGPPLICLYGLKGKEVLFYKH